MNNSHIKRQGSERPIKGSQLLKKYLQLKKQSQENKKNILFHFAHHNWFAKHSSKITCIPLLPNFAPVLFDKSDGENNA